MNGAVMETAALVALLRLDIDMKMFFHSNPVAFYVEGIHKEIPAGAVEITHEKHAEMIDGQGAGKRIAAGQNGQPVLVDPPLPIPAPVGPADLSPAQFEWLLAFTGLGDVWDKIEAAIKDTDRATYAAMRMQRRRSVYKLDVTLQEVAKMRPVVAQIAPDVHLSDAEIKAAWDLAEAV